jgi:RNA polymerase sigma-B factor
MAHYADSLDAPVRRTESEEEPKLLADTLGDEDERFDSVEFELSWTAALTRLPNMERRALTLRVQHNLKQIEIARELGCSQMHVSRLLRRGAAAMRTLTDPDLPQPEPT